MVNYLLSDYYQAGKNDGLFPFLSIRHTLNLHCIPVYIYQLSLIIAADSNIH
jgi:hypothetical protein